MSNLTKELQSRFQKIKTIVEKMSSTEDLNIYLSLYPMMEDEMWECWYLMYLSINEKEKENKELAASGNVDTAAKSFIKDFRGQQPSFFERVKRLKEGGEKKNV